MRKLFCAFSLFTTLAVVASKALSGCSITLTEDIKGYSPVILISKVPKSHSYEVFKATEKVAIINEGINLKLVCTGKKNVFENETFNTLELKCSKGNFIDLNNNVQQLNKLMCKVIPISSLKETEKSCSNGNGYMLESGFNIDGVFYGPTFEVCYNNITKTTLYTHNTLHGAVINYAFPEATRRPFKADAMRMTTTKANAVYVKKNQIKCFEKYFGTQQHFIDDKHFLSRGHLTPDADFVLPYEQLSTYYYINVAPQFQDVNSGNWLTVEKLARSVSALYKDDIETYNGHLDVLKLRNQGGGAIQIYLDDMKKIEVPKYYFKVLFHRRSDAAIVFVTVNNPFMKNPAAKPFCRNVCKKANLGHENFPDVRKGYTICCELNEFKSKVISLPKDLHASKLLKRKI